MPTLKDIAKQIGGLAVAKAPIKTGNLKRKLKTANSPSKVLKEDKRTGTFSFEIDYAPPGAEYGMFWNDPTVSETVRNGKTKNVPGSINFADKAINSPIVDSLIQDYSDEIAKKIVEQISNGLDDTANF
jgi:hypothetical protein